MRFSFSVVISSLAEYCIVTSNRFLLNLIFFSMRTDLLKVV